MSNHSNSVVLPSKEAVNPRPLLCWRGAQSALCDSDHFYLKVAGIDPGRVDLKVSDDGELLVPMRKGDSRALTNLMLIRPDGTREQLIADDATNCCHSVIHGSVKDGRIFCIDFATAWTVWKATGRSVIVCWEPKRLLPVAQSLAARADDCVAVDYLYPECAVSDIAGHCQNQPSDVRIATETGLPVYLAQPGKSFSTMGIAQTQIIFSKPPVSSLPVFGVHELTSVDFTGPGLKAWLDELSKTTVPVTAASLAWCITKKLFFRLPVEMTLHELWYALESAFEEPTIHPVTIENIFEELTSRLRFRRDSTLALVSLPYAATKNHNREIHSAKLPTLVDHDWRGVIIILAPPGWGKTQEIGYPFARWAAEKDEPFLAICHRVSLTTELSRRLNLPCYIDSQPIPDQSEGLAICLPSITLPGHQPLIDKTGHVFIDEISQVLQFIEAHKFCKTGSGDNKAVYEKLKALVANASCVVAADAGVDTRTLRFLESCRPNEQFRIIDVPEPKDAGKTATYYYGNDAEAHIACSALAELENQGRVWIAAEAKTSVKRLERFFHEAGYRSLAIHADNKGHPQQKRFIANADVNSLQYNIVIASPIIGSGISIEHSDAAAHFTLGLYIGGCHKTTPSEAVQQLNRVRYLKRFVIGLRPNMERGMTNHESAAHIRGAEDASSLDVSTTATGFDLFVAGIRAQKANASHDFSAGLVWQLEASGWSLTRSEQEPEDDVKNNLDNADSELSAEYMALLIGAPTLDDNEAAILERSQTQTESQNAILEAHKIRTTFGMDGEPLSNEAIQIWDRGRGIDKLDRLNAFRGIIPGSDDMNVPLFNRHNSIARAKAFSWLFTDIDLFKTGITTQTAQIVLDRILERRHMLAYLGIVPNRYFEWKVNSDGEVKPMKNPPSCGVKAVKRILTDMGLRTTAAKPRRVNLDALQTSNKKTAEPSVGTPAQKSARGNPAQNFYPISPESYAKMCAWADRRFYAQIGLNNVAG